MGLYDCDVVPTWVVRRCMYRGALRRKTRGRAGNGKLLWMCEHNHNQESRDADKVGVSVRPDQLALACAIRQAGIE